MTQPIEIAKVALTHPDKIVYPEAGITKLDIAQFHEKIADWILPYITNRPLTLLRCPSGRDGECFFQKHPTSAEKSDFLYLIDAHEKKDKEPFIYIKDLSGLIKLDQMGVLEIHPWGCKIDKIDKPDMIIFDLDPDPKLPWKAVIEGAKIIKSELEALDLTTFLKLTGGKGLHIVLPIVRRYQWDEIVNFAKVFVEYVSKKYPDVFVAQMAKTKRQDRIFVDYLRNHRGATAIAPYSFRARENAPIAVPVAWDELSAAIGPDHYHMHNCLARLSQVKDPWRGFGALKQSLPSIK